MQQNMSSKLERLLALSAREQKTRFAGGALGYLWAYVTPVFWIVFVVIVFNLIGRMPPINVGPEIFVASGILPYAMFRQIITSEVRVVVSGRHLRYLRPVNDAELMQAAAILELLNTALTAFIIFGGIILIFEIKPPAHLSTVYLAMLLAWFLGVGFGSLLSVLSKLSDSVARATPIILRPMFWISGIFYTATELSTTVRDLLWWNPLFHTIELLREGFFLGYESPVAGVWYPATFALGCMLIAGVLDGRATQAKSGRHRI